MEFIRPFGSKAGKPRRIQQKARSIIGSGENRRPLDFYPTPRHAIVSLLQREQFRGRTWEPAQGDGRIVEIMRNEGHDIFGSDLQDGTDFLATEISVENIITNPPFSLATNFLLHAKKCARRKIVLLCPLAFLGGTKRWSMFQDQQFRLKSVYVFSKRLQFDPTTDSQPMMTHAWFVWDRDYRDMPTLDWIDPLEAR